MTDLNTTTVAPVAYNPAVRFPVSTDLVRKSFPWMSKRDAELWRDCQRSHFATGAIHALDLATQAWWMSKLFDRQTEDEKTAYETTHSNKRGLMSRDESRGPRVLRAFNALPGTPMERFLALEAADKKTWIDVVTSYPKQMADEVRSAQEASLKG